MGYVGSEEFIRLQFEEYLLSLISSVKCHSYMSHHAHNPKVMLPQVEGDPANDFGVDWIEAWTRSENYRIWDRYTDSHLFDIVEPKHPCAGGLTIDDVQRRIAEQVKELHLDERFAVGKEAIGRNLAAGKEKASTVFNKLYADMEALRESQRRKNEERQLEAERNGGQASPGFQKPDINGAKQTVQSVGSKAGAYIGSWGTWMGEKRKTGWGRTASGNQTTTLKKEKASVVLPVQHIRDEKNSEAVATPAKDRPKSYNENLFDADANATISSNLEVKAPHPAAPSKFHETIDDNPSTLLSPSVAPLSEPAAQEASESSTAWEQVAVPQVDAEARSHAVAQAVQEAATTSVSP